MSKPAWSWKDYERAKRAEERKALKQRSDSADKDAAKRAAALDAAPASEQDTGEFQWPDSTRGHEGRVADGSDGLAPAANVSRRSPVDRVVPPKTRQACKSPKPAPPIKVDYNPRDPRPIPSPPPLLPDAGAVFVRGFVPGKIDISAAPSGMEAAAARWQGKGVAPIAMGPVTVLCEGTVMCRCGAQGPGQTRGPVPAWFGDKCIEANCELRARRGQTETEGASRG